MLSKKKVILVIDIGTSFVKLGLFDTNANPIEGNQVKFEHWMTIKSDGTYIFDALGSAEIIERGIDELVSVKNDLYEIIAVATDTMASTIVGLDANFNPLTPVYTYADTRSFKQLSNLKKEVNQKQFYKDTGCPMHTSYIPSRLMWHKEEFPELNSKINLWTDFSNYLIRRWLNEEDVPLSYSVASWTGMFDRNKLNWYKPALDFIGANETQFPLLRPYSDSITGLNLDFSKRWEPLNKVPFFLPVGDGASSNIGVGCSYGNKIALSIGTTGALRVVTDSNSINIPPGLWAYKLGNDHSLLGGAFSEGGNVASWLKRLMSIESNSELENILSRSKPDQHGLTVLPFLAGERAVGWAENATGTISGIRLSTTQSDIYQAFLESIAYRFGLVAKRLLTILPGDCSVVASGGAIQSSKYWLQLISDALGMPVSVSNVPEDTGRGTAILALNALGISSSFSEFDFQISDLYQPNEKRLITYQNAMNRQEELYSKIFI